MKYTTGRAYIEHDTFIKKWMEAIKLGKNQTWVATELAITKQAVSYRALYLRGKGVKLPNMKRGGNKVTPVDPDTLNKLIEDGS